MVQTGSDEVAVAESLEKHYRTVIDAILEGELVPFLGAGVNLCCRPEGTPWNSEQPEYLPSGGELAAYLARTFGYPETADLARVSQAVSLVPGSGRLYRTLHELFNRDYPPTPLHNFLAGIPRLLREKGYRPRYQLIVTTNYDDLMERAFRAVGQEFDSVYYIADGEPGKCGKFVHRAPDGTEQLIERPNEYRGVSVEKRPVILKIHGAVYRHPDEEAEFGEDRDSYVITEDHYIDYLTRADLSSLVPVGVAKTLSRSHILFLGYGLRDWNLRVILHRIWKERTLTWKCWAIQVKPDDLDIESWSRRNVEIKDIGLSDYVRELEPLLNGLPQAGDVAQAAGAP